MNPNDRQVGGEHYRGEYQHWDWMLDTRLGYLEGCASKYVARWRKKNGLQDLEKAKHYIEKLRSAHAEGRASNRAIKDMTVRDLDAATIRFCNSQNLEMQEREFMFMLVAWRNDDSFGALLSVLRELMDKAYMKELDQKAT